METFVFIFFIIISIGIFITEWEHPIILLFRNSIKISLVVIILISVFHFFRDLDDGRDKGYFTGPDVFNFSNPRTNYVIYITYGEETFCNEFLYSEFFDDLNEGKYMKWKHDNIDSVFINYVKVIEMGRNQFKGVCSVKEYSGQNYVGSVNYEIDLYGDYSYIRNKREIILVNRINTE